MYLKTGLLPTIERFSNFFSRVFTWLDARARCEALSALQDVLATERVGFGGDESGRVRVLSAASVRALRVPYLFLAGLSERAFPPPDRQDPLYSEAESQQLIEQGLPLVGRPERNRQRQSQYAPYRFPCP